MGQFPHVSLATALLLAEKVPLAVQTSADSVDGSSVDKGGSGVDVLVDCKARL